MPVSILSPSLSSLKSCGVLSESITALSAWPHSRSSFHVGAWTKESFAKTKVSCPAQAGDRGRHLTPDSVFQPLMELLQEHWWPWGRRQPQQMPILGQWGLLQESTLMKWNPVTLDKPNRPCS